MYHKDKETLVNCTLLVKHKWLLLLDRSHKAYKTINYALRYSNRKSSDSKVPKIHMEIYIRDKKAVCLAQHCWGSEYKLKHVSNCGSLSKGAKCVSWYLKNWLNDYECYNI